jgi:hypothetical protein
VSRTPNSFADARADALQWLINDGCHLKVAGFALGLYGMLRDRMERVAVVVNGAAERIRHQSVSS